MVRMRLPPLWSAWTLATWFAEPNVRLDGCRPADRLDADLDGVLRAARPPEPVDACAFPGALKQAQELAEHV